MFLKTFEDMANCYNTINKMKVKLIYFPVKKTQC